MSLKQAQKIEVGLHEGRPGFTIEYTDGERAHFVFHRNIARQLAGRLSRIVDDLDYMDRQMASAPSDGVGLSERVTVRLTPPPENSLGIGGEDGVSVND